MKNLHNSAIDAGSFRAAKFLTFYQANYRGGGGGGGVSALLVSQGI